MDCIQSILRIGILPKRTPLQLISQYWGVFFSLFMVIFVASPFFCYSLSKFFCQVTSPEEFNSNSEEISFVSLLVHNPNQESNLGYIRLKMPEGWFLISSENEEINLDGQSSLMRIFAIRSPSNAIAGRYPISIEVENNGDSVFLKEIIAIIPQKIVFTLEEDKKQEVYRLGVPIDFRFHCCNFGNTPIHVALEIDLQPHSAYTCDLNQFTILANEKHPVNLHISPSYLYANTNSSQFISIKVINRDNSETIYQHTISLQLGSNTESSTDAFVRIPARFSTMIEVDKSRVVAAAEFAGGGMIDSERNRYLEFLFRLPTSTQNVLYHLDEVLFLQIGEPDWDVILGDTIYEISELTQRRYGRGVGASFRQDEWKATFHYSQSQYYNNYNPREFGGYIEYAPTPELNISGNYLHKKERGIPTSNIITLETDIEFPENVHTEIEIGKNLIGVKSLNETIGYRLHTRGRCFTDTWCDIERIYAGTDFFGYYQDLSLFAATLDFPISCKWRCNTSVSDLKRDFPICSPTMPTSHVTPSYQRQCNVNFSYNYSSNFNIIFNGLVLRAKDVKDFNKFDFLQHWGGISLFTTHKGYIFNTIMSFGQQKDYLTRKTSKLLQSYYGYLSKEITCRLNGSLFYNIGNTNYYDARIWRVGYGALLNYHYGFGSSLGVYLQRVTHYPMDADLIQFSSYMNHTFSNLHSLRISYQHFHYVRRSDLNNNALVMSYTVPFGLPVDYRKDIGSLKGQVFDVGEQCVVPEATVYCERGHATTNFDGAFSFKGIPVGEYTLKAAVLPEHLITMDQHPQMIAVQGGKMQKVIIPVVKACSIKGKVLLYTREELLGGNHHPLIEKGGMGGVRILLESEENQEIYTCTSDAIGAFVFSKLRPGTWTIRIDSQTLPPHHEVNVNGLIIDLAPGEVKYSIFRVEPKTIHLKPLD